MANVKLHVFIQTFIFVLTPAFFFVTTLPLRSSLGDGLLIGILALACLPTTVSSCTVFTQLSGGNTVGAMFNASLANVLGIFLCPLLISLVLQGSGGEIPPEEALRILKGIVLKMFVPVAAGQVARIPLQQLAKNRTKLFGTMSNVLILFVVFFSFSKTVNQPDFFETVRSMELPVAYLAVSHLFLLGTAGLLAKLFGFSVEDRIAVMFTAPQKTLAMGVPLLTTYFAGREELLGIVIIPLLFYHPWQLLTAGILKNVFANKTLNRSTQ